jgi:hypothetical protein
MKITWASRFQATSPMPVPMGAASVHWRGDVGVFWSNTSSELYSRNLCWTFLPHRVRWSSNRGLLFVKFLNFCFVDFNCEPSSAWSSMVELEAQHSLIGRWHSIKKKRSSFSVRNYWLYQQLVSLDWNSILIVSPFAPSSYKFSPFLINEHLEKNLNSCQVQSDFDNFFYQVRCKWGNPVWPALSPKRIIRLL